MNFDIVPLQFDNSSDEPLYSQLFNFLKEEILAGKFNFGDKLPSIRTMAKLLGVNNITVVNAYKQLEHTGYATSKQGSGYYISFRETNFISSLGSNNNFKREANFKGNDNFNEKYSSKEKTSSKEKASLEDINHTREIIDFSSASPAPTMFPTEPFQKYLNSVIDRDGGYAFSYQEVNGFMPLREVLCDFVKTSYGIDTTPNYIQLVSGAQQGLDIISKSLLFSGDNVITENPTYYGAIDAFKSRGCRITSIEINSNGINLVEFEKKVRICRPKLVYIMPNFQNPTTYSYTKSNLMELLRLASIYNFYILEEDSMRELSYSDRELLSLKSIDKDNRVIYLKSFSKLLMPGLRIGFLIIPPKLLDSFTKTKQSTDLSSSGLISRTLDMYLRNKEWIVHLNELKETYNLRYEVMESYLLSLEEYDVTFNRPNGGVCFWLKLPAKISANELYEKCYLNGLLIFPSSISYPHIDKLKDRFIRISFASCNLEQIKTGCEILKECIQELILSS